MLISYRLLLALSAAGIFACGAYIKGRSDCNQNWLVRQNEIAVSAIEAYQLSIDRQKTANRNDRAIFLSEQKRLRDILERRSEANASEERFCITSADTDRVYDDYATVFEKRLQSGRSSSDAQ